MSEKVCIYCKKNKPLPNFNKHKNNFDGYDSRCKECRKKKSQELNDIKKTAPEKPERCDCCGAKPNDIKGRRKVGLVCDHDHETKKFRGWLCQACNKGIGQLGDDIEGVKQALEYLIRVTEEKKETENE